MNSDFEEVPSKEVEDTKEVDSSPVKSNKRRGRGKESARPRLNYTDVVEDYRPNDGRLAAESQKMYEGLQNEDAEIEVAQQEGDQRDQEKAATKLELDLAELKDMFSNFDPELVQDLYLGSNLDKQATAEALLKLSREGGGSDKDSTTEDSGPTMSAQEYQKKFPALRRNEDDWEFVPREAASPVSASSGDGPSYKDIATRHRSADAKDADDFVHVK
ncbi:hypothetical protein FOZ60_008172 [Perkinsus olseni]|uniref:CUE domain-containing protein n=1 Tax=Perkinsus olseni TaxID=32597 RepID=A0A7J6NK01_PEROL|nr:hypothetical protein FOZ60_008172 [Perkinsus olseni]